MKKSKGAFDMLFWFGITAGLWILLTPALWFGKHTTGNWVWQGAKLLLAAGFGYITGYLLLTDHNVSAVVSCEPVFYLAVLALDLLVLAALNTSRKPAARGKESRKVIRFFTFAGVIVALGWLYMTAIYPITIKKDLYRLVNVQEKPTSIEATDVDHIPTVPIESAQYTAEKLIGKLQNSSYYQLGQLTRQKINGREYWIAPLEYKGYFTYRRAGYIPGYIQVSAEDKNEPAQLKDQYHMIDTSSAFFGHRLDRLVRERYPRAILLGSGFEPDDSGKPYYVIGTGHYTKFRTGLALDGAVLVDPQTGDMKKYSLADVPQFVDFVAPASLASTYNEWQAKYKHGFWNTLFGRTDINDVTKWNTGEEVIGVFGPDGGMYWFTDHSTPGTNSMVGYTLMNGRTGQFLYYTGSRGMSNGKAALDAVHNTFKKDQWTGTNPVLYNIYGTDTWYIPVVDANGLLRQIALVNAGNTQIVAYGDTKEDALNAYKVRLSAMKTGDTATPTTVSNMKEITGKVLRVGTLQIETSLLIDILLDDSDKVFTVNPQQSVYASFLQVGDTVTISYADTEESIVSAVKLFNQTLEK